MEEINTGIADILVIFGITGDLARKMTLISLYRLEANKQLNCPIIGIAMEPYSDQDLHQLVRKSIEDSPDLIDEKIFRCLVGRMSYLQGDLGNPNTYQNLAKRLVGCESPIFYLEIPPSFFAPVAQALAQVGLLAKARVVIEKPFGHDLDSARHLNVELHQVLREEQIWRIDHFLGKQPVLDIHFLRFGNSLLEPVWNRNHIAAVQITMAEDFGVQDRGRFYDSVGALRDVVQNHLMQLLALVAMEPPSGAEADALEDKKVDVFRSMPSVNPAWFLRGQYDGYGQIPGVKKDSDTETYVGMRLEIDNWRWAGVPFFIRAGKVLPVRATEIRIIFKRAPRLAFLQQPHHANPNEVIIRIDPDPGLRIVLLSKAADGKSVRDVHLDLSFAQELGKPPAPYERLIHDALIGDRSLFSRQDTVEQTWRILQPLLENPVPVVPYSQGTWGPKQADNLVKGHPSWRLPWLSST